MLKMNEPSWIRKKEKRNARKKENWRPGDVTQAVQGDEIHLNMHKNIY